MRIITRQKLYERGSGLAPGELIRTAQGHEGNCAITVHCYGPDKLETIESCEPEKALACLGKGHITWIQVRGVHDETHIRALCEGLGMHRLAIEDVLSADSRSKFEEFGPRLFVVSKAAIMNDARDSITIEQVSIFIGEGFLLSIQEGDEPIFEPVVQRLNHPTSRVRQRDVSYLLFALLDIKNDYLMNIIDSLDKDIVEIEEAMLSDEIEVDIETLYQKKRALLMLMRIVLPMRDNANRLELLDHPLIKEDDRYFFRDLADYSRRAADRVEHARLIMQNMQEFHHAEQEHKINRVMKVLTVIATLFLPLTFIAGVYGMNFDHDKSPWNMPELYWYYGYPACLLFMASIFFSFLWWFKKQKWI